MPALARASASRTRGCAPALLSEAKEKSTAVRVAPSRLRAVGPVDPAEVHAAEALHDRLVQRALAMEGTCSGEHGVGYGKSGYLEAEHGPAALGMMRAVKAAIDPLDLMNPGKVLPAP
ncbi:MAG: hypothetical protein FJW81_02660 [Actinobacteria bacterium]|nr:hypothetical protein [Actinomycetota bacterium]